MSDDIHEIFAIRYGELTRPKAVNFVGHDPHDQSEGKLTYFVWAIKGPHGNFVVDTGFDAPMAKRRGRTLDKPIEEGLKAIGIAPDSVKDVIDDSDVIVIGNKSPEFIDALEQCRPDQIVIDLVRVPVSGALLKADYRGICW